MELGFKGHIALVGLLTAFTGLLVSQASAQSVLKEELKVPTQRKWGVAATVSSTRSLHKDTDVNHSAESRMTISPNYRITDKLKTTASFSGVQQLNGGQKSRLSNTRLSLQHSPIAIRESLAWFPTVFSDLPTDVEGRKKSTYRANIAGQATGIYSFDAFNHGFTLIPIARYTRNFHRLTRSANNTANIQQSALGSLVLETGIAKNLSVSLAGSYSHGWTYQTSTREQFSFSQELSYEVDKSFTVSLGHSNDGNVFAADGQANNVRLYDENTSAVYISLRGIY